MGFISMAATMVSIAMACHVKRRLQAAVACAAAIAVSTIIVIGLGAGAELPTIPKDQQATCSLHPCVCMQLRKAVPQSCYVDGSPFGCWPAVLHASLLNSMSCYLRLQQCGCCGAVAERWRLRLLPSRALALSLPELPAAAGKARSLPSNHATMHAPAASCFQLSSYLPPVCMGASCHAAVHGFCCSLNSRVERRPWA